MTKICTLLELSLVVKKSYCDLELKSSQQYFNTITARRFTACHKPLAHRTHCWSFPRLQQQWQVFLLPLVPCKERQTIVLFFRSDHFIDSTTPPPYFLFVVGCDSWEHVTWNAFEPIRESMKFPLYFKYSGAQSIWELEDLTGVISNGNILLWAVRLWVWEVVRL